MKICKNCGSEVYVNSWMEGYYCPECNNLGFDEVYYTKDIHKMLKEWEEFKNSRVTLEPTMTIRVEEEMLTYLEIIRRIITRHYGKEVMFRQSDGTWYSREHCRYITLDELEDILMNITDKDEYQD